MRKIKKGSVSRSVEVYIIDSTDGTPETGVVFNTAGIDLNYRRDLSAVVAITEVTLAALTTAYASGGFLTIGFGTYRLDVPDAAWATGADHVTIFGTVTGMIVLPQTVQLVDYDPESAASLGLTNLDAAVSGRMATYTQPTGFLAATFPSGTVANTTNITAGTITTTTNLTNLPAITANWLTAAGTSVDFGAELATAIWGDTTAGDFTVALSIGKSVMNGVALGTGLTINAYTGNTVQTGDSFARIGLAGAGLTNIDLPNQTMDITGNLSGSVGSVTGAVGSVTGAVGSVTGLTAATVHSDLDDIQARLPAALTGAGNIKADMLALNGSTAAAALLAILNGSTVVYQGTVTGAVTTTTLIDSGLTQADADWWKGRIIIFTSVITLQATDITAFDPTTDTLTFTAVTAAPTGATYVII